MAVHAVDDEHEMCVPPVYGPARALAVAPDGLGVDLSDQPTVANDSSPPSVVPSVFVATIRK